VEIYSHEKTGGRSGAGQGYSLSVAVICATLNTGRWVTDGLNRFVRCARRSGPASQELVGIAGRETRRRVAPTD
jgi:hypothetical protein